jgi:hypothetical protein
VRRVGLSGAWHAWQHVQAAFSYWIQYIRSCDPNDRASFCYNERNIAQLRAKWYGSAPCPITPIGALNMDNFIIVFAAVIVVAAVVVILDCCSRRTFDRARAARLSVPGCRPHDPPLLLLIRELYPASADAKIESVAAAVRLQTAWRNAATIRASQAGSMHSLSSGRQSECTLQAAKDAVQSPKGRAARNGAWQGGKKPGATAGTSSVRRSAVYCGLQVDLVIEGFRNSLRSGHPSREQLVAEMARYHLCRDVDSYHYVVPWRGSNPRAPVFYFPRTAPSHRHLPFASRNKWTR